MKKIHPFVSALMLMMFISCSNDEINLPKDLESANGNSGIRTVEEAIQIARSSFQIRDTTMTRASLQSVEIDDVEIIKNTQTRTSDDFSSDTLIYAVNYADNKGFALISANPATEALLAVTDSGSYSVKERFEIEGFNAFMDLAEFYVRSAKHPPFKPQPDPNDTIIQYDTITSRRFPLIMVNWGQTDPQGRFCPNGVAGCGPIAVAQILTRYEYPTSISLTYPNADIPTQNLDWSMMRYYGSPIMSGPLCYQTDSTENAIGRLCRQLGNIMDCIYFTEPFPATAVDGLSPYLNCFNTLGYTHGSFVYYSSGCTKVPLDSYHPLLILGYQQNDSGHAFVIDGYYRQEIHKYTSIGGTIPTEELISTSMLNHVNWGWNGSYNGYFNEGVYVVTNSEGTTYNFSHRIWLLEAYRP